MASIECREDGVSEAAAFEADADVGRPVDLDAFKAVLGRFATGVSVMTTIAEGSPHGMTVNALASVSLEPPLVLVCVERGTVMAASLARSGTFALSFLAVGQAAVSEAFADSSRPEGADQFAGLVTSSAVTGAPIFPDAVAWVDCRVWATYDGGDHVIVIGEVVALDTNVSDEPLLYYRSEYGRFRPGR